MDHYDEPTVGKTKRKKTLEVILKNILISKRCTYRSFSGCKYIFSINHICIFEVEYHIFCGNIECLYTLDLELSLLRLVVLRWIAISLNINYLDGKYAVLLRSEITFDKSILFNNCPQ